MIAVINGQKKEGELWKGAVKEMVHKTKLFNESDAQRSQVWARRDRISLFLYCKHTSYSAFLTPGVAFLMDIPGAKHFLLFILTTIGVVPSRTMTSLQQLNSIMSLWSLNTTPQLQVAREFGHNHCLVCTYSNSEWGFGSYCMKLRPVAG